jgi:amino acid transporter
MSDLPKPTLEAGSLLPVSVPVPVPVPENRGYTPANKASIWRTVVSIAWAFFGVRKDSDYQEDIKQLNIFHIIFVGIAGCFLLVIGLMLAAKWASA